jgi:hypothetical protein
MIAPRTRPDSSIQSEPGKGTRTLTLDPEKAELAKQLHETELDLAIQSTASRLLSFALARAGEDEHPDE